MRKLTKEELEIIEKYDIQFKEEEGYILDYENSDIPTTSILSFPYENRRINMVYEIRNDGTKFLYIDFTFSKERKYKNIRVGEKYLFHDGEGTEKVFSKLSKIDKESEKPFVTELGNSFKHVEKFKD